jgi:hypothetical protein
MQEPDLFFVIPTYRLREVGKTVQIIRREVSTGGRNHRGRIPDGGDSSLEHDRGSPKN